MQKGISFQYSAVNAIFTNNENKKLKWAGTIESADYIYSNLFGPPFI